ncbi:uncharacterized protein LOC110459417 isoform X2 [Mizuhopecten yessoensis]|uniref:uncharacterized protein LOC110459417 isoform X2 n=1 Tax=Mizuhopecten yessoensis TaxID=6573 RepID=UPI000B45B6D3|nr:uncharacterized protein LOC110459417 isoform X2 [Mizuhopecten yessoensis]
MENVCTDIPNILEIPKENISDLQGMLNGMISEYELSDKQLELAGEVASALAMQGRFEILGKMVNNICQQKMEKFMSNESFLRALVALKFEQKKYKDVVNLLKKGRFSNYTGLLEIWDEAHYGEKEEKLDHKLNALIRFRVRQKNPPPPNICPSGERPSTKLSAKSKHVLNRWFLDNFSNPYPSQETKQYLAQTAGLTTYQVKTWFANARRRHRLSGRPGISGRQKEPLQEFFQEYHGSFYSKFTRNVPSHPTLGNPQGHLSPQSTVRYQNVSTPTSYNRCNMTNLQKSPGEMLPKPTGEFPVSGVSKVPNTGYLNNNEPRCYGSCIRELARMCEKLQVPNNQTSHVTRVSTSQNLPQWTSPRPGPWQNPDTPHQWGPSQTPMVNTSPDHIVPMEVHYYAEETPTYPAFNSMPQQSQATPGYLPLPLQSPEGQGHRYFPQGVHYGSYQTSEMPALANQQQSILNPHTAGLEGTGPGNDPYTLTFEPQAYQTLHPQSEREVAMVLLDLSSDRSAQSSQSSQSAMS